MNRPVLIAVLAIGIVMTSSGISALCSSGDSEAVISTIEEAYVKGIHIERDIPAVKEGFHEDFRMSMLRGGALTHMSIAEWIGAIEKSIERDPSPPRHETRWEFPMVDVTGDAAVAKVEIFRDGTHIYSDYLSLYRFEDGWKIVSKIYFDHRQAGSKR